MLDREGAKTPGDLAVVGDEATLREGLCQYREAGVTDLAPSTFAAEEGGCSRPP